MSVQKYETDVLQEHIDSTPILIERLEQWSRGVHIIQEYVHGYVQVHLGISHNLEKTLKNIGDAPTFPELPAAAGGDGAANNASLANVFQNLQTNTNLLLQRSTATANGIKNSIVPQLDQIVVEIDKHYKALRTQGGKGIKDVEKSREHTQKAIEQLGRVTSSFGSRTLSHHDDPYILHRRVESAVADQVGRENTQADAALSVQKSFASLETHIMQTLRQSLAGLASLNDGYSNSEREVNDAITGLFKGVDLDREWGAFQQTNAQQLVPTSNYQRDPARVTFVNKNHPSTQALISGSLSRKSTVLKNWNQAFYAVTPSGFLHQLKSADPSADPTPELSLFLPDCQLSKSLKPGESVFKIVGKDTLKKIGGRHKYVFKTSSPRELETWYAAIARVTGNIGADDDVDSPPETDADTSQPQSPVEPPTAAFANTGLDDRAPGPVSPVQANAPAQASAQPTQANVPSAAAASALAASSAGAPPATQGNTAAFSGSAARHAAAPPYEPASPRAAAPPAHSFDPAVAAPVQAPTATASAEQHAANAARNNSFLSENDPFKSF